MIGFSVGMKNDEFQGFPLVFVKVLVFSVFFW